MKQNQSQASGGSLCNCHGVSRPLLASSLCHSPRPRQELLRGSFQVPDVPTPSFPLSTGSHRHRPVWHCSSYGYQLSYLIGSGYFLLLFSSICAREVVAFNSFCLSSLVQDQEGLVVSSPSGRWTRVPNCPGLLVVNTGELLRQWANDCVSSTPHFVVNLSEQSRWKNRVKRFEPDILTGTACPSFSTAPQPT